MLNERARARNPTLEAKSVVSFTRCRRVRPSLTARPSRYFYYRCPDSRPQHSLRTSTTRYFCRLSFYFDSPLTICRRQLCESRSLLAVRTKKKKNGNINDPYKHGIRFESDTSAMLFHSSDITDRFISYGNGNVHA